ncbi:hypothetical protein FQA39_LY18984 [Lamprigera yunnana]|nr:hypothetical protein FQA39_LY18984 [Lamprigera yunnana]
MVERLCLPAGSQGIEPWNPCRVAVFPRTRVQFDHSAKLPGGIAARVGRGKQQALYAKSVFALAAVVGACGRSWWAAAGRAASALVGCEVVFEAAVGQGAGGFQDGVGDRAQQRVDAFQVADQVDVQRAGFDALQGVVRQALQVRCRVGQLQVAKARFFFEQLLRVAQVAGEEDAHRQAQVVQQVGVQFVDFLRALLAELAALFDFFVLHVREHALDDVADLLHVDGEVDDFRPALAFVLAQLDAGDLGHVVLDGRVQLVHRVVELAQVLRQLQVVGLHHVVQADQHGFDHIGLVQRFARGAGDGQRRGGERRWIEVAWPLGGVAGGGFLGQQLAHPVGDGAGKPDEAQAVEHVECQVRRGVAGPQAGEGGDDGHAQHLEDEVAHGDLAHFGAGFGGLQNGQHAAAQHQSAATYRDEGVGKVEGGEVLVFPIKIKKIHDIAVAQAIQHIAHCATQNAGERQAEQFFAAVLVQLPGDDHGHHQANAGKKPALPPARTREKGEGRAGVVGAHDVEKPGDRGVVAQRSGSESTACLPTSIQSTKAASTRPGEQSRALPVNQPVPVFVMSALIKPPWALATADTGCSRRRPHRVACAAAHQIQHGEASQLRTFHGQMASPWLPAHRPPPPWPPM